MELPRRDEPASEFSLPVFDRETESWRQLAFLVCLPFMVCSAHCCTPKSHFRSPVPRVIGLLGCCLGTNSRHLI